VAPGRDWIAFDLTGRCASDSRAGHDLLEPQRHRARATVHFNGQQQVQEVQGGSGFCAQNQRRLHFGLGPKPRSRRSPSAGLPVKSPRSRPRRRAACTPSRSRDAALLPSASTSATWRPSW
jgi:hypothetical protein